MEELPDLRIRRPYSSLDEYLEGDFWTVERKEMFLIGVESLELGVAVRFTIELEDGTTAVTGEGRVVEYTAPSDDFPGGIKVRFRQLDADAKAVLRRALEVRRRAYQAQLEAQAAENSEARASAPAESLDVSPVEALNGALALAPAFPPTTHVVGPTLMTLPTPPVVMTAVSSTMSVGPDLLAASLAPTRPASQLHAPPKPRTGMRQRAKVVSAPPNRDALLGRLRARVRGIRGNAGAGE